MKVSIIIPTYNRQQYICQAIESALSQTFADIEVIVVDDGSTDNTREVIKPYKGRIKYIYTKNRGPAHARNTGMKIAKGDYISFLDSDDLYYPYKTLLQANFLDKFKDIGMVYTEFSAFDDNGFWNEYHLKKYHTAYKSGKLTYEDIFSEEITMKDAELHFNNFYQKKIYMGNIFDAYFRQLVVFTNSIMFRRYILKTVGLQNESYWLFEEYEFALRICKKYKIAFIDVPTYKLRYHRQQISGSSGRSGINIVIKKQENLLEIGKKFGVQDKKYYSENRRQVNKRMSILHKSLAIPLMALPKGAKTARIHMEKSASYGYPAPLWRLLTFFPFIIRRIVLKLLSILKPA